MAGLLSDILGFVDRAKQSTRANVGLLMDNPQEYARQINESARDINRQDTLAVQGKNAMLAGRQPTPEQMAAMDAMRQRTENLAMGFSGVIQGVPKESIKNLAEEFAKKINDAGFLAKVEHSGSKLGPSSYINVSDPMTGRYLKYPIRISGHSKGPYQSQFVYDVTNITDDLNQTLNVLNEMRSQGPALAIRQQKYAEDLISKGIKPKLAYKQAREEIK